MSYDPEIDICTYLGHTMDSLTCGTNLFYGGVLAQDDDVPALCVFVLLTGGASPQAFAGTMQEAEYPPTVQVIVRGGKEDYPEAKALARNVFETLRYAPIPGYIDCEPLQAGPYYIGLDEDGHHTLSLNFKLLYQE